MRGLKIQLKVNKLKFKVLWASVESDHVPLSYQESVLTGELDAQKPYFTNLEILKQVQNDKCYIATSP